MKNEPIKFHNSKSWRGAREEVINRCSLSDFTVDPGVIESLYILPEQKKYIVQHDSVCGVRGKGYRNGNQGVNDMLNIRETEEYKELQGILSAKELDILEFNAALDELFSIFTADPNYEKSLEGYKAYILTDTLIDCLQYGIQCCIGEYEVAELEELLTGELFSRYLEVYFNLEFSGDLRNINEDYIKALKDEYISEYFEYFRYKREKSRYDNEFELFKRITEGYNFYSYRDENEGSVVIPWTYTTYNGRENYYDAFGVSLNGYVGIVVDDFINRNYEMFISEDYSKYF